MRYAMLAGLIAAWLATPALGQCQFTWKDSQCSSSRLGAPTGATCRATGDFSCGAGGAYYQYYSYILPDSETMTGLIASSANGKISTYPTIMESAKADALSSQGQNFSSLANVAGAQVATFDLTGRKCVRAMRMGPQHKDGPGYVSWVRGNKCAPPGQPLSQAEIDAFVSRLTIR